MELAGRLLIHTVKDVTVAEFVDASILDTPHVQQLGQELFELPERQTVRKLVLDFSNVRYLSSSAVGVLLTLRRKCDEIGGRLAVAALRPEIHRIFTVTRLDGLFEFYPDEEQALQSFGVCGGA